MAKSIKLGSDIFLDSTGVATDSSGTTLAQALAFAPVSTDSSSATLVNCTGTLSFYTISMFASGDNRFFGIQIRARIANFNRTGANPGFTVQSNARPVRGSSNFVTGFRSRGDTNAANAILGPDGVQLTLNQSGLIAVNALESYSNTASGGMLFINIPFTIIYC